MFTQKFKTIIKIYGKKKLLYKRSFKFLHYTTSMRTVLFFFTLFINQLILARTIEQSTQELVSTAFVALPGTIYVDLSKSNETKVTIETDLEESQIVSNLTKGESSWYLASGASDLSMKFTLLIPAEQLKKYTNAGDGNAIVNAEVLSNSFEASAIAPGNLDLGSFTKNVKSATLSSFASGNVYSDFKSVDKLNVSTKASGKIIATGQQINTLDVSLFASGDISLCSIPIKNPITGGLSAEGDLYVNPNTDTSSIRTESSVRL